MQYVESNPITDFNTTKNKEKDLLSLKEYLTISKKYIESYGRKLRLIESLMQSEDIVAHVAYRMMLADLNYNPDYNKSRKAYRAQSAYWAIKNVCNNTKRKNKFLYSLDLPLTISEGKSLSLKEMIPAEDKSGTEFEEMLNISHLTDRERNIVTMVIKHNHTFADIGRELNLSRERVRQIYEKSLKQIKYKLGY